MLNELLLDNEKVNYEPLVLINNLFNIVEHDTGIQGYWKDNSGKVYIDNIALKSYSIIDKHYFNTAKKLLFQSGEKCIAYKNYFNELIIEYPDGKIDTLKNRITITYTCKPCELDIKLLLKKHDGLTVYKIDNGNYLIEIYK